MIPENISKEYIDSGIFKKAMDISIEIVKNDLSKIAPKKGTPELDAYNKIKKEKIEVYKNLYKKSPNLIIKDVLDSIYNSNNLDDRFEVKNFKYWGRVVQSYVWGCISLKSPQGISNPQSLSPQLYILVDNELLRAGICYGDYLKPNDDLVIKVKENNELIGELWNVLDNNIRLDYYNVNNEGLFALKKDYKLLKNKNELADNWNAGSHISAHYKYNEINENTVEEIIETINSLVSIFRDICSYSNKVEVINNSQPTYWLYAPGKNASKWDEFYNNGVMAIGWDELSDLSRYSSREAIVSKLQENSNSNSNFMNDSLCCYEFANKMQIGDIVICKKGRKQYLGYGVVDSDYYYDSNADDYKHRAKINWISKGVWEETNHPIVLKTLTDINKYPDYVSRLIDLLGIENGTSNNVLPTIASAYNQEMALKDLFIEASEFNHIIDLLSAKQNIILQGPPGVGKSFISKRIAYSFLGSKDDSRVEMIQFHQSYSYEDFIQGYRPSDDGNFILKDGVFYNFCNKARENPNDKYVFIIDEINRGNLSKIFGELMLLVENDKRGPEYSISLTYADNNSPKFYIPKNLYIIGMMNTADRSLAMVDYALRRRFCFIDLAPQFESKRYKEHLKKHKVTKGLIDKIVSRLLYLNNQIAEDSDLGIGYQIGHSFFTPNKAEKYDENWYNQIIKYEVEPLIKEYWFDSIDKVNSALDALKK